LTRVNDRHATPRLRVDAVRLARGLATDVPVPHIGPHELAVALVGRPETAATAGHRADDVPTLERDAARLQHPALVLAPWVEHDEGWLGGAAAEKSPRRRHRALEPEEELGRHAVER